MGQKVNPNIYRISNAENWNSRYTEKKSNEFYLYQAKDLQLKKFIIKFFKKYGLNTHKLKLNYSNNNLDILTVYTQSANSVLVIDAINKNQKIKLTKNKFTVTEKKRKNYKPITKTIKKIYSYEALLIKKRGDKLKKKKSIRSRIKILKYFKKYLAVKNDKSINNSLLNNFLEKLLVSLSIFFDKAITISLILKPLLKNVKKIVKEKKDRALLKRKLIKLKKFEKNDFFRDGINSVFLSLINLNSASLLSKYVAYTLGKLKRHNFFLLFLKKIIETFMTKRLLSAVKAVKIKIKGRINGASRARKKIVAIGQNIPVLTLKAPIDYAESTAYTANGTIGVKVWLSDKTRLKKNA